MRRVTVSKDVEQYLNWFLFLPFLLHVDVFHFSKRRTRLRRLRRVVRCNCCTHTHTLTHSLTRSTQNDT